MSSQTYASLIFILAAIVLFAAAANAQEVSPVNCTGRPNAPFVWGCSRYYSLCEREREVGMMCRRGELFRWTTGECEKKEKVPECASQEGSETTLHEGPPFERRRPVDCSGRPNGSYVWGCSYYYSICEREREYPMICLGGHYFRWKTGKCAHREEMPECATPKGKATTLNHRPVEFTCPEQYGNFVKNNCSTVVFRCVGGYPIKQACGDGDPSTVFDPASGTCVWRYELPECDGQLSETVTAPGVDEYDEESPKVEKESHKSPEAEEVDQKSSLDVNAEH